MIRGDDESAFRLSSEIRCPSHELLEQVIFLFGQALSLIRKPACPESATAPSLRWVRSCKRSSTSSSNAKPWRERIANKRATKLSSHSHPGSPAKSFRRHCEVSQGLPCSLDSQRVGSYDARMHPSSAVTQGYTSLSAQHALILGAKYLNNPSTSPCNPLPDSLLSHCRSHEDRSSPSHRRRWRRMATRGSRPASTWCGSLGRRTGRALGRGQGFQKPIFSEVTLKLFQV